MKVKDLVNICQNQWSGLFSYNKNFVIKFTFEDCENIETFSIDEFNNYHCDGICNWYIFRLLDKRHNQNVIAWDMSDLNTLNILVKEF